jgi:tripartite-type tricarboxylate transporter receptor subunit TctC
MPGQVMGQVTGHAIPRCCAFAAALLLSATISFAEPYPNRVIKLIVPFPAGGSNDVAARIIAPHLEQALGQTVIVDNRPAAGGIVGSDAVAKAQPDGHTLLLVASSYTVTPALNPKLPYDSERDFAPISLIDTNAMVFFVNPKVAANNLTEFIALAKQNPGKFNYSSPGAGSQTHLLTELLSRRAGISMQHLPYKGGAPAMMATITGEAEFTLLAPNVIFPHIKAGTIRPIATGGAERHPQLPDVQTTAEAGFPEVRAVQWVGMFTTAGTPGAIIDRLNAELNRIVRLPDVAEKFAAQGVTPTGSTSADFRALITSEIRQWTEIVRAANIKVE